MAELDKFSMPDWDEYQVKRSHGFIKKQSGNHSP